MNSPLLLFSMLCLWPAIVSSSHAQGKGGMEGGGGDETYLSSGGAAWILLDHPVSYCVERDRRFPFSEVQLQERIERSFQTWVEYIQTKKLKLYTNPASLNLLSLGKCSQSKADVSFYFGSETQDVAEQLKNYQSPIAIQFSTKEANVKEQGAGVIWVRKQATLSAWDAGPILESVLLHEIGHALGNQHVAGTIMDAQIFQRLSTFVLMADDAESAEEIHKMSDPLLSVDQTKELYTCIDCAYSREGALGEKATTSDLYRMLTDHAPDASGVKAVLKLDEVPAPGKVQSGVMEVSSADDRFSLPLSVDLGSSSFSYGQASVFKIFLESNPALDAIEELNRDYRPMAVSSVGVLKGIKESYPIFMERNMGQPIEGAFGGTMIDVLVSQVDRDGNAFDSAPVKIYLWKDGKKMKLFGGN